MDNFQKLILTCMAGSNIEWKDVPWTPNTIEAMEKLIDDGYLQKQDIMGIVTYSVTKNGIEFLKENMKE